MLGVVRAEFAAKYVAGVVKVSRTLVALLTRAFFRRLVLSGFVLIHVALFAWLPRSLPANAPVLLILGVSYLNCVLACTLVTSPSRAWTEFAKVDRFLAGLDGR